MRREERAKQFMPFDAMKGLREALQDREERYCRTERHDISDEQQQKNSAVLRRLCRGDRAAISCWHRFHDVMLAGCITEINTVFGYLRLDTEKIWFEDIYSIEITDCV